mgnify:CR=1 FL=1
MADQSHPARGASHTGRRWGVMPGFGHPLPKATASFDRWGLKASPAAGFAPAPRLETLPGASKAPVGLTFESA